jgi:hypothetical protein
MCFYAIYWLGLYPEDRRKIINAGIETMMRTTIQILGKKHEDQGPRLITGEEEKEPGRLDRLEGRTERKKWSDGSGSSSQVFCCFFNRIFVETVQFTCFVPLAP